MCYPWQNISWLHKQFFLSSFKKFFLSVSGAHSYHMDTVCPVLESSVSVGSSDQFRQSMACSHHCQMKAGETLQMRNKTIFVFFFFFSCWLSIENMPPNPLRYPPPTRSAFHTEYFWYFWMKYKFHPEHKQERAHGSAPLIALIHFVGWFCRVF